MPCLPRTTTTCGPSLPSSYITSKGRPWVAGPTSLALRDACPNMFAWSKRHYLSQHGVNCTSEIYIVTTVVSSILSPPRCSQNLPSVPTFKSQVALWMASDNTISKVQVSTVFLQHDLPQAFLTGLPRKDAGAPLRSVTWTRLCLICMHPPECKAPHGYVSSAGLI